MFRVALCIVLVTAFCETGLFGFPTASADQPAATPTPDDPAQLVRLQNKAANPIATLIDVPFQYNVNFDYGPYRRVQQLLNVEPSVPFDLGGDRTLIVRTVLPFYSQPATGPGVASQLAIGDVNPDVFYVPKQGALMMGYGGALFIPTGTAPSTGTGKWSAGPAAIVVVTEKSRVIGLLVDDVWSIAGDSARNTVNQAQFQAFAHFAQGHGFGIGVYSDTTVNWNAPGSSKWNVPFGPTAAQLVKLGGGTAGQIVGGLFWNVVHPAGNGNWTARLQFNLLRPAK